MTRLKARQLEALKNWSIWVLRAGHRKLFRVRTLYDVRVGDAFRCNGRWFYLRSDYTLDEIVCDQVIPAQREPYNGPAILHAPRVKAGAKSQRLRVIIAAPHGFLPVLGRL